MVKYNTGEMNQWNQKKKKENLEMKPGIHRSAGNDARLDSLELHLKEKNKAEIPHERKKKKGE